MHTPHPRRRKLLLAILFSATVAATLSAAAAGRPIHVRGTITQVAASGFTVQTGDGPRTIAITDGTRIAGVVPTSLGEIRPGSFIGSANVPNGNTARALEVVVFPPAMKGMGLGDYPWDLPARGGRMSTAMTNGNVMQVSRGPAPPSAMTNGTVKAVTGQGDVRMVVDYGKGEKTIEVPAGVPVVTFKPADRRALVVGAHVFVAGQPGEPVAADVVTVGLDGAVPPM
ncbi:hypothetical protein [Rhodanobacter geophilus]|uniref:DUF5666 domain-containing protein n=1 Tax=Rhodanobacter geophilus TaxID=3162488 RepID=A0ABV3QNP6_9GAMM